MRALPKAYKNIQHKKNPAKNIVQRTQKHFNFCVSRITLCRQKVKLCMQKDTTFLKLTEARFETN